MTNRKSYLIINITQALIWVCIMVFPTIIAFLLDFTNDWKGILAVLKGTLIFVLPSFIIYALNYYLFIPYMLFAKKKKWFYICNFILLTATIIYPILDFDTNSIADIISNTGLTESQLYIILTGGLIVRIVIYVAMSAMAVGLRYIIRWQEDKQKIEEERRRNAEAELNWLKNQLNPHFLFNTLNNISSLTQIDPDKAQECIGQLSELLRYALYESNIKKVKISDEILFMKNYINLMSLRCNEKTSIYTRFDDFDNNLTISPLLFISLIENAFKHGTSSHQDSLVKIDMGMNGEDLVFSCENSIHERRTKDNSGSGIGLENMCRRLELIYPQMYSYRQYIENNTYITIVTIRKIRTHV